MQRRQDELRGHQYAALIEEVTGAAIAEPLKNSITKGADEVDLVRSGLDDTMRLAYQEIRSVLQSQSAVKDLRTAAYVVAIRKIARSYLDIGLY